MNLTTLKGQVEMVLATHEQSRNSDIELTVELWKRFYPTKISRFLDAQEFVKLTDMFDLPHESEIGRIRRKFQNDEHKYFPTVEAVAVQRGILAEVWRKWMSMPEAHAQVERKVDHF